MNIKIYKYFFLLLLTACEHNVGETVESAWIEFPLLPEPEYKFSRNGTSNVDLAECHFLKEPIDKIYSVALREARMNTPIYYNEVYDYYNNGLSGLKPKEEIARSAMHQSRREELLDEVELLLQSTAQISGYGKPNYAEHRNRRATIGSEGYVGRNVGDKNTYFVNEKGLVIADVFLYNLMGSIYLDKILNIHLDNSVWEDKTLRTDHENVVLQPGKNYTDLEHHLDLAYGYYQFLKPLVQADGIPALRGCNIAIERAFVQARYDLGSFYYDRIAQHIKIIRENLSKAIAVRAIHLLSGNNTIANLNEGPEYAFLFLSQAYGLIQAMQFATSPEGTPYFSPQEVKEMCSQLMQDNAFWNTDRLLAETSVVGSLKNIANRLGMPFGISHEDINK